MAEPQDGNELLKHHIRQCLQDLDIKLTYGPLKMQGPLGSWSVPAIGKDGRGWKIEIKEFLYAEETVDG